jgi:putative NADH-flavin reductase
VHPGQFPCFAVPSNNKGPDAMKIAIVGATGFIGTKLVDEAVSRGHEVVAVSRTVGEAAAGRGVTRVAADASDTEALTRAFKGVAAVLHAAAPSKKLDIDARIALQKVATASIIAAVKAAGVPRVLAVGGAGTLEIAPGIRFMDSYIFPRIWFGGAHSTAVIKELLQVERDFEWTVLCPPYFIEPGVRTGNYREDKDRMIVDETGRSAISVDDYAVAMIDELERPRHAGERFTVAY